jgi:hypothetical protein
VVLVTLAVLVILVAPGVLGILLVLAVVLAGPLALAALRRRVVALRPGAYTRSLDSST